MNHHTLFAMLSAASLFLAMLVLLEVGRRMGERQIAKSADGGRVGFGAVEGAVFGLLGLLIAFTFSGAAARFDSRRQLIIEETNAIGTAYLRLDLLPAGAQPELRDCFRRYVDSRLAVYRRLPDIKAAKRDLAGMKVLQGEIWTKAVAACREGGSHSAALLLLPALNQMIDITSTRTMVAEIHPPAIVFAMLAIVAMTGSLLAGYGMAGGKIRSWIHTLGFAAIMATTMYVILDIEYPRLGLIRIDPFDRAMTELRQGM
ncbi:MAG: hypothetical protein LLG00_12080 [Planctomycetaceae bacterium]|nr:hypothetical protein [Planctomycetaceae bacterium]